MNVNFLAFSASGLPIISAYKGNQDAIPFAILGTLQVVSVFSQTHGAELLSSTTEDSKVVWKVYNESLTLILIHPDDGSSDHHSLAVLELLHQALVMLYGTDNIKKAQQNPERLKRDLKVCSRLIDHILEGVSEVDFSLLTHSLNVILGPEVPSLQSHIDVFCEMAGSPYGCLVVGGRLAAATAKWWQLPAVETVLLLMLLNSLPSCTSRDMPVFLPITSPEVPHRLLTFNLMKDVQVMMVCGPTPSLQQVESEVVRYWKSAIDALRTVVTYLPRNFPSAHNLDQHLLGFVIVNSDRNRCIWTIYPHQPYVDKKTSLQCRRALAKFYRHVQRLVPKSKKPVADAKETKDDKEDYSLVEPVDNLDEVKATYVTSYQFKLFSYKEGSRLICTVFDTDMPKYAQLSVTKKTLEMFKEV